MKDYEGKTWERSETQITCEDGRFMLINSAMTDEFLMSQVRRFYGPQVPASVSMLQARLALIRAGLFAHVDAAIKSMPGADGDEARATWEFAQTVERNSPLIGMLATPLGLSDEELDALFIAAGAI